MLRGALVRKIKSVFVQTSPLCLPSYKGGASCLWMVSKISSLRKRLASFQWYVGTSRNYKPNNLWGSQCWCWQERLGAGYKGSSLPVGRRLHRRIPGLHKSPNKDDIIFQNGSQLFCLLFFSHLHTQVLNTVPATITALTVHLSSEFWKDAKASSQLISVHSIIFNRKS